MKHLTTLILLLFLTSQIQSTQAREIQTSDSIAMDSIMTVNLDEFTVTASRVVDTPAGYRMRVAGSPLAKGKDATRLLEFLPNLSQEDGIIKINGLTATEITIDGRKISSPEELKQIPAEYIETIEVRYLAKASQITESAGGTIAIRLKPAPRMGLYGMIHGSVDTQFKKNSDDGYLYGSVSARIGKISLYEAISGGIVRGTETYDYTSESPTDFISQSMDATFHHRNVSNTLAVNLDISERHILGISWNLAWRRSDMTDREANAPLYDINSTGRNIYNTLALNYTGRLGKRGDRLSVSAEWLNRKFRQTQDLHDGQAMPYSTPNNKNTSDLYKLSLDWEHPVSGTHVLNAGVTYNLVDIQASRWDTMKGDDPHTAQSITTHTPMPYVSAQGKFGRFGYYGGLSWQSNILCMSGRKKHVRSSLNPTLQLTIPIDRANRYGLTVMYKHLLDMIPYDAMVDKETWQDANTYSVGNPGLKDQEEDYVSLMARLFGGRFNLSADFSRVTNQIEWQTFSDSRFPAVTYTKPVNLNRPYISYGIRAEYTQTLLGCWTLKGTVYVGFRKEDAHLAGVIYNQTRIKQSYSLLNSFTFPNGWGGYVRAYVEPTFRSMDRTYHKVWNMDLRVYRSFLKNDLYVWIDLQPCGNRRRLDRMSDDRKVSMAYTTPVQHMSMTVQYRFRGGKKDIDVKTRQATVGYNEITDGR